MREIEIAAHGNMAMREIEIAAHGSIVHGIVSIDEDTRTVTIVADNGMQYVLSMTDYEWITNRRIMRIDDLKAISTVSPIE